MSLDWPSVLITLLFGCTISALCCDPPDVDSNMSTINSPADIEGLRDIETPHGVPLSGQYKRSFAYATIKDRLPVILTRIIDNMSRSKESIIKKYGEESSEELKLVIGNLSRLRSEIMTNKPLQLLNLSNTETDADAGVWNSRIQEKEISEGKPVAWFTTEWLFCETYMYRRLSQIYTLTKSLSALDYFEDQKRNGYTGAISSISDLTKYTLSLLNKNVNYTEEERRENFRKLMKLNLWGNRCDLSHSGGAAVHAAGYCGPADSLASFEPNLLIDDTAAVWSLLSNREEGDEIIVDIVLDNAGYEFVTDLCLATFMIDNKLATKIRFHVKRIPWFVSDVTERDFNWTIGSMRNSSDLSIQEFGEKCQSYLKDGVWTVEIESFWTEPFDYSEMKYQRAELYSKLSEAKLIVFKGDLNYRKLLGDINWDTTTDLVTALRGFRPSNLVTLRTIKADLCVGLPPGKADEVSSKDGDWLISGQYGLIHATIDAQDN